jgi:hypothetical protein
MKLEKKEGAIMRRIEIISLFMGGVLLILVPTIFFSCANSTPTTPTPTVPDCEKYHTGVLRVSNQSSRGLDYDVIIDGVNQGRLTVGATKDYTLAAGQNSLDFKYSDHDSYACTKSYPYVTECQTYSIYCTG